MSKQLDRRDSALVALVRMPELQMLTEEAAQHLVKTADLAAAISLPDASFVSSEGLFHD